MYNAFIATRPKARRQKEDDPIAAGAAKVPSSAALASKEELKEMASRLGWEPRELSYEEVQKMSSAELRFHEVWNKEALDRAFTIEQNKRTNAEPIQNVKRMWEGRATPNENEKCRIAGDTCATRTPQFARTIENAMLMIEHMQAHVLD